MRGSGRSQRACHSILIGGWCQKAGDIPLDSGAAPPERDYNLSEDSRPELLSRPLLTASWPGTSHSTLSGLGAVLCNHPFRSISQGKDEAHGPGWEWKHLDHGEKAQLTRAWGAATPQRVHKVPSIYFASQMSLRNTRPIMRPLLPNLNCFMASNVQGVCQAWSRQG